MSAPSSGLGLDGDSDSLFTDMPDWLSSSAETPAAPSEAEPPAEEQVLETSQLPAWVQAMRPVEAVASELTAASNQTVEARGALAGLQGVLPVAANYKPSSKPKAYSLKLQVTEDQLSQATLLEQIIAAETSPVPIASFAPLAASRGLRWTLAAIFFLAVFVVSILGTQIFALPASMSTKAEGAWQLTEAIPANQPVLVAFDYQPARAGEMEAAAAPVIDRLAVLKAPRFALISTNEPGGALAEKFMRQETIAAHVNNGLQYVNLGYLPGGQMGIRAFVETPKKTAHFDVNLKDAWDMPALQGIDSFSRFAAVVVITDSADDARAWLEQIAAGRFTTPVIVVSSAQSAPMLRPYYASGQITGLIGGLPDAAAFEQKNALQKNDPNPGTIRGYWDAYSIGAWLAVIAIIIGGAWSAIAGMRERNAMEAN